MDPMQPPRHEAGEPGARYKTVNISNLPGTHNDARLVVEGA